jgi:hypothetical protein
VSQAYDAQASARPQYSPCFGEDGANILVRQKVQYIAGHIRIKRPRGCDASQRPVREGDFHSVPEAAEPLPGQRDHRVAQIRAPINRIWGEVVIEESFRETTSPTTKLKNCPSLPERRVINEVLERRVLVERLCILFATEAIIEGFRLLPVKHTALPSMPRPV